MEVEVDYLTVRYDSDILGSEILWEGLPGRIEEIYNIPARMAAREAIKTGHPCQIGMWTAIPHWFDEKVKVTKNDKED